MIKRYCDNPYGDACPEEAMDEEGKIKCENCPFSWEEEIEEEE